MRMALTKTLHGDSSKWSRQNRILQHGTAWNDS